MVDRCRNQPIAIASERSKTKLVADPAISIMDLYYIWDKFLTARGSNDLVYLLKCIDGVNENESPTKYGPIFRELKDLLLELVHLAPNTVLPRQRLLLSLEKLNKDRRWHFANRTIEMAASDISLKIRTVMCKLRMLAQYVDVFHRFVGKATAPEYEAVDELMGYIHLQNTVRGSSCVFQRECSRCDDAGLSSIFDKVLTDGINQLKPIKSEGQHRAPIIERKVSKTLSMESLQDRRLSRKSSTDSFDSMATIEYDHFPIYSIQVGEVANQPVVNTVKSCGRSVMEPKGNMKTPPRQKRQREPDPASEQKSTKFFVKSEPVPASEQKATSVVAKSEPCGNQCLPVPDLSFKFKSDETGKTSGDVKTALATTPPPIAAPRKVIKKPKAKAKPKAAVLKKSVPVKEEKGGAKAEVLKKSVSMKDDKGGAKHGSDGWSNGKGKIMRRNLVYNRAYKRTRHAELKKGKTDDEAKEVASAKGRDAVKIFLAERGNIDWW